MSREMLLHIRRLERHKPNSLERGVLVRIRSARAAHQLVWLCRLEAAKLHKSDTALKQKERAEHARILRDALSDKKRGLANAFAKLRTQKGKPIGFLRGDDVRVASHPGEVDAVLQASWAPIYDGNAPDHKVLVVK